jgi:hypothetical protein
MLCTLKDILDKVYHMYLQEYFLDKITYSEMF